MKQSWCMRNVQIGSIVLNMGFNQTYAVIVWAHSVHLFPVFSGANLGDRSVQVVCCTSSLCQTVGPSVSEKYDHHWNSVVLATLLRYHVGRHPQSGCRIRTWTLAGVFLSTDKSFSVTKSAGVNSLIEKGAKFDSDLSDRFVADKIGQCKQCLTRHR